MIATVPVGSTPHGVAIDWVTDTIYVGNVLSNTVSVIDGRTNKVKATVRWARARPGGRELEVRHRLRRQFQW